MARPVPVLPNPMSAAEFLDACQRQQESRRASAKADPQTETLVQAILESAAPVANAVAASVAAAKPKAHQVIKLGIDVHLERYVVVRQFDGGVPQPAQSFSPEEFMKWAQKQPELAAQVYSCYEAGPFGYSLHRKLTALGLTNYVVRPRDWDEYGKQVKTDKRDAKELVLHLDRYVGGNTEAFCVVRVPSRSAGAGPQPLAPAGEYAKGAAAFGRPGAQSRLVLWRAPARGMVAGSSVEGVGRSGHRAGIARAVAPAHPRPRTGAQCPDPGAQRRRPRNYRWDWAS